MKRNKLYLILAITISIILFAAAALCDGCLSAGARADDSGEENGTEEEPAEETAEEDSQEEETVEEETGEEDGEEESAEEEPPEEESTSEEETEEKEEEVQHAWEEPTIDLVVYEGPVYSSADDICYWRVEAIVNGVPTPTVEFNRDDSAGAWGSRKAQVNLANPTDSFSLQATATNSQGSATDSITLTWECNRSPEITDIVMMGDHFVGVTYSVSVSASDPDGDTLTFDWSVSGGSLNSTTGDVVEWTMPALEGDYQITVEADDGNGNTAERTETIEVTAVLGPPMAEMELPIIPDEGGWLSENGFVGIGFYLVGDTIFNSPVKGFISFDITSLSGATVEKVTLSMERVSIKGDPSGFLPLWIGAASWEPGPLEQGDYDIPVSPIESYIASNFLTSAPKLKLYLQNAINAGNDRFQIVLFFTGMATDNDGSYDHWGYDEYQISLNVEYTH